MKIAYVVPGFGNTFYCQNCIQNLSIFKGLSQRNHTAVLVPMYIPFSVDMPLDDNPIFFGAINVYLKEYVKGFKHLPHWTQQLLNSKKLLQWVSKKSGTTDPKGLEKMTIAVMQGADGSQKEELNELITWLRDTVRPDIVHLSNALLIGIGVEIKSKLNIPVVCTVQDENHWLDSMEEPYISQGWSLIQNGATYIDSFVSMSQYFVNYLTKRLNISHSKFSIIPGGIDPARYTVRTPAVNPPTIGYLSRITDELGIDSLLSAFRLLKKNPDFNTLQLKISGGFSAEDKHRFNQLRRKINREPFAEDVHILPEMFKEDINAFFENLTVLSVPSHEPEAFGLFLLESLAAGIPVVQPHIGGYPEIISNTGGGITYQPNTPERLAESLSTLLTNKEELVRLSNQGLQAVARQYGTEHMISKLLALYSSLE